MDSSRKGNHHRGDYISFSEALFTDAITIAGVRVAEVKDGTDRYAATWLDEYGQPRLSVCGKFGAVAIMYRYAKRSTTTGGN
jgi:hypothetical protein